MSHPFIQALAGGVLIGAAAALLLLLEGRIAGVSGVFGQLVRGNPGPQAWRLGFIAGLVISPLVYQAIGGPLGVPPVFAGGLFLAVAAGLLTGFGTALGKGCTSGHGVCGLSRLSPRSLVATLCFMAAGFATVFVLLHLVGG